MAVSANLKVAAQELTTDPTEQLSSLAFDIDALLLDVEEKAKEYLEVAWAYKQTSGRTFQQLRELRVFIDKFFERV